MGRHTDETGPDGVPDGIADSAQQQAQQPGQQPGQPEHDPYAPNVPVVAPPPDPQAVDGVVDDGSVPVPLKVDGEPMRYRRDLPRSTDQLTFDRETGHIVAHLASIADADDNPDTHAGSVHLEVLDHLDGDPDMISIVGTLDAEPVAPYLRADYDPAADDDGTRFTRYSEVGRPGEEGPQ